VGDALRLLLVDFLDPPALPALEGAIVRGTDACTIARVPGLAGARAHVGAEPVHVAFAVFGTLDASALDAIARLHDICYPAPVVVATADPLPGASDRAIRAGADDCLTMAESDAASVVAASRRARARADRRRDATGERALQAHPLASMVDGVFVATDERFVHANAALGDLLGYAPAELIGKPFAEVVAPAFLARFTERYRLRVSDGPEPERHYEVQFLRRDGTALWMELRASRVVYDGARSVLGVVRDISTRKLADERFRQVVEFSPYGMVMFDREGRIVLANSETGRIFGYPITSMLGRKVDMLIPERFRGMHEVARAAYAADPTRRPMGAGRALHGLRADGREVPLEIGLNPVELPEGTMVLATIIDVTEKIRLDAELQRHRHHLQELVNERTAQLSSANRVLEQREQFIGTVTDALPGLVSYWDRGWRCRFANATYARWFGAGAVDMLGKRYDEVFGTDLAARNRPHVDAALRGEPQHFVREFTRADGSPLCLDVHYIPDEVAGRVVGHYVLAIDITDLSEAQSQLARLNRELSRQAEEAQAATRAKSNFLANMSHEIRTPMNAVIGIVELMRRGDPSERQGRQLDKIDAAARHLLGIINTVLDLSKIEAGKLTLDEGELVVAELVQSVASMMQDRAGDKRLALRVECDPFPGPLVGDRTRLSQALLNYVGNAIKFTREGEVVIRARRVGSDDHATLIRFEVEDTGVGIPEDALPRLFQAFEQADATTARRYGGTGLGLAITRRLAELMGGGAGATSRPGHGSTFWFTARLTRSHATVAVDGERSVEDAEGLLKRDFAGTRVLLAEDDEINQEVAGEFLREAGLEVDVATDGRQAVRMAVGGAYALVLMDMQMPGMDGMEATREIARLLGPRTPPIVAMTANAFAEDRARCAEAGMCDFVAKPFEPALLFATVLRWLAPRRS
jgi:two-component system, sensor histidine kinase and response regulator